MKKIFLSLFIVISLLIPDAAIAYEYNSDTVTVYVTVNDITDVDNPLNTIVERHALTVSNFDISEYGESFTGLSILDSGVTYLHVLIALHEELYGKEAVADNLKLDSSGVTRIFMGKSIGSIMYKNGNYIFAIPQYVTVKNGDEINICLYDEGYNQAIASFNQAYVVAETGSEIDLSLYMHHWYPELSESIEGAQIVDENGVFITDSDGNIITTDVDGDFSVTFDEAGVYKLTILPTVGYYMSDNGGTWVTWYEEEEVEGNLNTDIAAEKAAYELAQLDGISDIQIVSWDNLPMFDELGSVYETYTETDTNTPNTIKPSTVITHFDSENGNIEYTYKIPPHIELIEHQEFVSGEASQKVDYTTPWVVINITDDFTITNIQSVSKVIYANAINEDNFSGQVICAAYDYDDNGAELFSDMKITPASERMSFNFPDYHDVYKLYVWDSTMNPVSKYYSYTMETNPAAWNFTQPAPENVIITGE